VTGETNDTDENDGPDGWGVIHNNPNPGADHAPEYMFGPVPIKALADLMVTAGNCDCRKHVVPVFFPRGIKLMLDVSDFAAPEPEPAGPIH
jgi:hypothetical protein